MNDLAEIAAIIADDICGPRSFSTYEERVSDMDAAYAIQDAVTGQLIASRSRDSIGGYKMAFNSPASMQYYSLAEPCVAPVYGGQIVDSGAVLDARNYHTFIVEPEICIVLGKDIPMVERLDRSFVVGCIDSVRPSFELLDHRGAFALDPSAALAVAQGIYNVGAVLGKAVPANLLDQRASLVTTFSINGATVGEKIDAAPQDPIDAISWMAGALARRGQMLKAGMIVLCGTHLPSKAITALSKVEVSMGVLGTAHFELI